MKYPASIPLLLLLCIASSVIARAQQDTPVIRVSTQFVTLDVLVEDRKTGAPISGLQAADFEVLEDGKPQAVSYFNHDQLPLSVVLLFDLTDTVQPILKPLALAAHGVLDHLKANDEVSVMVFSSHTTLLQDFTNDRGLASAAVERASAMKSAQATFIHEDMYEAIEQALTSKEPESRRVMVWLTDGTANFENSRTQKVIGKEAPALLHTKQEATAKLMQSGVAVAALIDRSAATDAFIAVADVTPMSFFAGGRMGDINKYADMTGGPVLKSSKKEVAARLAELIDQLRARDTLGYKPASGKPPGSFCKLQVRLSDTYLRRTHMQRQDFLVRSREGYLR
jgi:VWFA-related protein